MHYISSELYNNNNQNNKYDMNKIIQIGMFKEIFDNIN